MRSNVAFMAQLVAVLVLAGVMAFQIADITSRASLSGHLSDLTEHRAGSDSALSLESAKAALRRAPNDTRLQLLHAHCLFTRGEFAEAISAYKSISRAAPLREVKAAALAGRAAALLARRRPPSGEDVEGALGLLEQARGLAPGLPDIAVATAVSRTWAGDEEGASEAMAEAERLQTEGRPPGVDAQAAWYCLRCLRATQRGDIDPAYSAVQRAAWIMPARGTVLDEYLARSTGHLDLEAAARPGAPKGLLSGMLERLEAEGQAGISEPGLYPAFLRAAAAASRGDGRMRSVGMELLEHAIGKHPRDPAPVIYRIAALTDEHAGPWASAAKYAGDRAAGTGALSVYDVLPGAGLPRPGASPFPNRVLAKIEKKERSLLEAVALAAERAAALDRDGGADIVLSLARFSYAWKMRQADLSTDVGERRRRQEEALEAVDLAEKLLGERMPRGEVSARLFRDKGVVLAGRLDTEGALAALRRCLELRPDQPRLAELLSPAADALEVVATCPGPSVLHSTIPLVGAEFRLPIGVTSLEHCTVKATLGPRGGEAVPVEPHVARTGLWYLPERDELSDGDMEARFAVGTPFGHAAEAVVRFRIDNGPPRIADRFPAEGARISDRRPLFRVEWQDLSGIDPDTVGVVLDPVNAEFFRQTLVEAGRQRTSHFTEPKWRRGDPAVEGAAESSGEFVTAAMSELPAGSYRLTVRMEDKYRRAAQYAWEFTVQ